MEIYLDDRLLIQSQIVSQDEKDSLNSNFKKNICYCGIFSSLRKKLFNSEKDSLYFRTDWAVYTFGSKERLVEIDLMEPFNSNCLDVRLEKFEKKEKDFFPDHKLIISGSTNLIFIPYTKVKNLVGILEREGINCLIPTSFEKNSQNYFFESNEIFYVSKDTKNDSLRKLKKYFLKCKDFKFSLI